MREDEKIGVVGLGYVGLPVALGFARHFDSVVGFDIDASRVSQLREGVDRTNEVSGDELKASRLLVTSEAGDLDGCTFFVVTVPTPIDPAHRPDLTALEAASRTVGRAMGPGALVVYESTVYPGLTEEFCGPILEAVSGLTRGADFHLGYSPERINPGDKEHTLERTIKVVAAESAESLSRVAKAYEEVVPAGVHRASSIAVAEAAKIIENTQRDINIALMNELALIFDRLDIRTADVLAAAGTKWNFLGFHPGLVGGHCIGVDPYYLTARAESVGYHPQVILAGRRINNGMGQFVAQKMVKLLIAEGSSVQGARVGILGLTFKENVPDLRNSRVPDIITELEDFGVEVSVHDPLADAEEARREYGLESGAELDLTTLDGVILAVPHESYLAQLPDRLFTGLKPEAPVIDIKSCIDPSTWSLPNRLWSL